MYPKRNGQDDKELTGNATSAVETARLAANPTNAAKREPKPDEHQMSLFWRVFGGTILSMVALGAITLYNSIASNISELRSELSREREARAELVKKDEFTTRSSSIYERIRSLDSLKAEHEGCKERVNANAAAIEALKRDSAAAIDGFRKETAGGLDGLRKDVVAATDAVKKDALALDSLKEKLAGAAADLKAVRDDVNKFQQEVERNKAADLERKLSRDAQYKQVDETLKELQKGLQDCREKMARLEGMQPPAAPRGALFPPFPQPSPAPAAPSEAKGAGDPADAGVGKSNSGTGGGTAKPGPGGER